jgi:hypothetical protein
MVRIKQLSAVGAGLLLALVTAVPAQAAGTFLGPLSHARQLASTVPPNGDVNPYGTVVVPATTGRLHKGWVMVSNFNAKSNEQGTGTTLVQISPTGSHVQLFAKIDPNTLPGACPGGVGLTTALTVLRSGWVVVGSLPTRNGTAATAKAGCLLVLGRDGKVRETITNKKINGPWDMTSVDHGRTADLFITNVLNGTVAAKGRHVNRGTVVRLPLRLPFTSRRVPHAMSPVVIGSGFGEHSDPAALVVGPTGVAYDKKTGTLFVADTADNRISAIHDAATRMTTAATGADVTANGHLNSPLGLVLAPNGHLLSVNAGNGLAVETTRNGSQVATRHLDNSGSPAGAGALFGLAIAPHGHLYFVDDATNMLDLLH